MNEINTILDWITNGVPLGDTSLLPTMPIFGNSSQLGVPDLELKMPTYASTATSNSDDYVCFSIPTGLLQNRRIKAIEVIPGNLQTVHHVLVSVDPFPNSSIVTTADCMGPQGDMLYSYAPGALPLTYPENTNNSFGVVLPSNSSVSFAMHYPCLIDFYCCYVLVLDVNFLAHFLFFDDCAQVSLVHFDPHYFSDACEQAF